MVRIRIRAVHDSITYDRYSGFVSSWPMSWSRGGSAGVMLSAMDGMKILNRVNTQTAEAQELSSARVGNLLDDANWPTAWRALGTGDVTCQAYTPACTSILSLLRQVEDTEGGLFFIDAAGDAVFQEQTYRSGAAVQQTFGENAGEIGYEGVSMAYDDIQIRNRVEVQRVSGANVASEDVSSIAVYLESLLQMLDTLHIDDTESTTLTASLLARYKDPHVVLDLLRVNPGASGTWAEMLNLEISDLVKVRRRPSAGNTIDLDFYVESISERVDFRESNWIMEITGTQYV